MYETTYTMLIKPHVQQHMSSVRSLTVCSHCSLMLGVFEQMTITRCWVHSFGNSVFTTNLQPTMLHWSAILPSPLAPLWCDSLGNPRAQLQKSNLSNQRDSQLHFKVASCDYTPETAVFKSSKLVSSWRLIKFWLYILFLYWQVIISQWALIAN